VFLNNRNQILEFIYHKTLNNEHLIIMKSNDFLIQKVDRIYTTSPNSTVPEDFKFFTTN